MKDRQSHKLIDRVLDENGVQDKYGEFDMIDFDNDFVPLEQSDREIHASQSGINNNKEDEMKGTRKEASYIDELSSGFDATVQNDYEAGKGSKGQIGKGKTEEVAKKNSWEGDKRDSVGRAAASATLRRTAAKLVKMADAMDADEEVIEDDVEDIDIEAATCASADADDVIEISDEDDLEIEAATKKEAAHPMEHKKTVDDPSADMPSDTGDEWIDIGSGEFDDKRDGVGKAA